MSSWKEIVQNYITKHSDRIKKTTKPLRDHFGINYFTYHQIDNQGRYTVLVDRPDWAEHYVDEQIFFNDPYLRHPEVYQSGTCLVESHGSTNYRAAVSESGKSVLNADLGVILIQKRADSVEFFGFAGSKKSSHLQNIYLNHPNLLKSFSSYFKKSMGDLLINMKEAGSSLLELKGRDFLRKQPISPKTDPTAYLAYLKDLGVASGVEKLSPREKECLQLLIENKSAKETGDALGLSYRTIEYYFENIKNKLSCSSKQEVLQRAKNLAEMGIL